MICRFFLSVLQRMETEKLFRPIRPQGPTWWMWLRQTHSTACYGFCFKNALKKCNTWCINKFSIHYLKHLEKTGKTMGKKVCKMPIKEHIRYWKLNVNKCEMFLKNHSKQCILFNIHSICNYEIRSILGICVSKPQNNVMFWT